MIVLNSECIPLCPCPTYAEAVGKTPQESICTGAHRKRSRWMYIVHYSKQQTVYWWLVVINAIDVDYKCEDNKFVFH